MARSTKITGTIVVAVMVSLVSGVWVQGQMTPPASTNTPTTGVGIDLSDMPPVPALPTVTARRLLAEQWVVLAAQMADGPTQPSDAQLELVQLLLEQALALEDKDAELWRFQIELARRMNRAEVQQNALQKYLALQPGDDAAQLDLILLRLSQTQTVEARLTLLQRLLDAPTGQSLSAPLRSRLASMAAAAALETGDNATMGQRLRQAAQLDASNRQAMVMIADLVRQRGGNNLELGTALIGLLRADGLNPLHRRALADLLVEERTYDLAADQYAAAQRLSGGVADELFYRAWVTSLIISGRHEEALQVIAGLEQTLSATAANQAGAQTSAGDQVAELATLPVALEILRLAVLSKREAQGPVQQSWERLAQWFNRAASENDDASERVARPLELAWLKVAFGPMEQVEEVVKGLPAEIPTNKAELKARVEGWALLRQGKPREARNLMQPFAEEDPAAALGVALSLDGGTSAGRSEAIAQVLVKLPVGLVAVMAAGELQAQRIALPISSTGLALGRAVRGLPRALREPDFTNQPWVQFSASPAAGDFNYLDPIGLRVVVRNLTDMPLAMEPDGVLPIKVMVRLQPRVLGQTGAEVTPVVIDLRRQLVLGPRQSIEVNARLDWSAFGGLLATSPAERVTFAGLAALDVQAMMEDRVEVGPLGMRETIRPLERFGLGVSLRMVDVWLAALAENNAVAQMRATAWLLAVLPRMAGNNEIKPMMEEISEAVVNHFDKAEPMVQAWMVRMLQADPRGNRLLPTVHDRASKSEDVRVRLMYLATQVSDPNAPAIDAALGSDQPTVKAFAGHLRTMLRERAAASANGAGGGGR